LPELSPDDLAFADRSQLTPLLSRFTRSDHVNGAVSRNTIRVERVAAAYSEIASAFERAGVDHVVLKGFTHVPEFIDDINLRVQYDLDLYVPELQRDAARDALLALQYESIESMEGLAMDHLPTMIRKTGWRWRDDYFDPDFPVAVEVHFQFWDVETERIRVAALEDFWTRRSGARLNPLDALGYAALHLTRHLLRGNVRAFHVWEIANFLDRYHADEGFWRRWDRQHPRSLQQIEAVAFLLAKTWFGCRVADIPSVEIDRLPPRVHRWFELYGWSPIESQFEPNKDELWLHMSLLDSFDDRWSVLRRRLIPTPSPQQVDSVHVPEDQLTAEERAKRDSSNRSYATSRAAHHSRLLIPTLLEGVQWWFRSRP
jgi:putative nucleotidyltransferase-like protein